MTHPQFRSTRKDSVGASSLVSPMGPWGPMGHVDTQSQEADVAYRYLGNKTALTPWIIERMVPHLRPGAHVADPMCGTGAMAEALARAGFRVHASDELTFPVLHAKARLLV